MCIVSFDRTHVLQCCGQRRELCLGCTSFAVDEGTDASYLCAELSAVMVTKGRRTSMQSFSVLHFIIDDDSNDDDDDDDDDMFTSVSDSLKSDLALHSMCCGHHNTLTVADQLV